MLLWRALAWSSTVGVLGAVFVRLILGFKPDASGGVLGGKSVDIVIAIRACDEERPVLVFEMCE